MIELTNEVHEVIKHGLEMRVPWNSDCNVNARTHGCPNKPRHALCPLSTQNLDCQTDRVDVWTVVRDDTQGEDHKAELAEAAKGSEKYSGKKASSSRSSISVCILVLAVVERGSGHNGNSEHLSEEQGDDEANPYGKEDLRPGLIAGLVDCVVCCVTGPSCRKTINHTSKAEHASHFAGAHTHWDVDEISRMREDTKDDDEDDGGRDPRPEFVEMDNLVAEEGNKQRTESNDDNASVAGNIVVDGIDHLGADDRIHC